jgi:DNA-binding PadR family transcriptional regulator
MPWQGRESRGGHGRHGHSHGWDGAWGGWGGPGGPGRGTPPPWLAGLFGMPPTERSRSPRVRRGDVRSAIVDVVATADRAGEAVNGYQVIQQIAERSDGAWRPSPGSVYPTVQQLHDEGLLETDDERGRRTLRLTAAGRTYADDHADELAAVWAPFERAGRPDGYGRDGSEDRKDDGPIDLKAELGQVLPAVWQILSQGSPAQRQAALEILADTRRRLYGVLADGPEAGDDGEDDGVDELDGHDGR